MSTVEQLQAEIDAIQAMLQQRTKLYDERSENVDTRIRSIHDSMVKVREVAVNNQTLIATLSEQARHNLETVARLENTVRDLETKMDEELDKSKEEWSNWISELSTKLWRAAGVLVPAVLAILALVLRG